MRQSEYNRLTDAELRGRRAKTNRVLQSGNYRVQSDTLVIIDRKYNGLSVRTDSCHNCGVGLYMTKVPPQALDLLPEPADESGASR